MWVLYSCRRALLFQNNFIAEECNTSLFLCFDTSSPFVALCRLFALTLCCFFTSTLRCFFTTLLLRFDTALLLHHVASSLRHCVASSPRCFFASTLCCFFALTLRCFFASTLRCFFASTLRSSSLRHCIASSLQHCIASSLQHCVASSPCNPYLSATAWLTYPSVVCTQSSSSSWFFVSSLIMVVFVDSSKTPKNQFITILSHADEPIEEGITLAVFPSVGEFSYIPKYWEWLEDILSRNKKILTDAKIYGAVYASLFTYDRNVHAMQSFLSIGVRPQIHYIHSVGEISITLWDLCFIGGLPLYGSFYDEVVPSAKEMSSLPSSCEYLFAAFHHLSLELGSPHLVTSTKWVGFWFRGSFRYPKPPNKQSLKRLGRGKLSHNPRGIITTHRNQCRTEDEEATFQNIKSVEKGERGDLAGRSPIVASSMARGKKYCLAVPVLATIYKGLNDIASFSVPSKCDTTFPAHYLNAWLAEYFATHFDLPEASPFDSCMVRFSGEGAAKYFEEAEARKLFRSITKFKFHCLALFKRHQEILEDNDQLSDSYVNYFISQRPSYLSSRRGDLSVLEPYSPHRFGCQFGFTQDIPGEIKEDLCTAPLERVISRSDSDRHWRCRKYKDNVVDDVNHEIVMKMTEAFIDVDTASPFSGGDEQVSLSSFFDSANMEFVRALCCLFNDHMVVSVIQELVEDENLDISLLQVGVDSLKETFDLATKVIDKSYLEKSNAFIPPLGPICNLTKDMVSKVRSSGVPTTSIVLILNAEDVISKASRHYAFMLGEGLIEKIIKTPFDSVASLKEEFMENASQYSSIRSALTQRISLEVKNQRRADAERLHTLALKSEAIEARDSSIAEAELSKVLSRETELRKELELLVTQRGKLENSISLHEEKLPQL
uniref:Aminotransferase-like plant mobile domain-containing protein n=1 Tax=Fagus sylvatica TaxID=28930 RepID=A0A2N9H4X7_FAGSY